MAGEAKSARAKQGKLGRKTDEIVSRINQLVRFEADASERKEQRSLLRRMLGWLPSVRFEEEEIVVVDRNNVKELFRKGRQLPHFEYDPVKDEVSYTFQVGGELRAHEEIEEQSSSSMRDIVLPVEQRKELVGEVSD